MEWRFKIELYLEQLELIIDSLTVAQWDSPPEIKIKYKAVQDFLEPIARDQKIFLKKTKPVSRR